MKFRDHYNLDKKLLRITKNYIEENAISYKTVRKKSGLSEPKFNNLMSGNLEGLNWLRLMNVLLRLGADLEITARNPNNKTPYAEDSA